MTSPVERGDLVEREVPLGEDVQHFAPDIAGRAGDDDSVAHNFSVRPGCYAA